MNKADIKPGMLFIAADGDGIGKKVGRAVIANDFEELSKISARIDAAQDFILHWSKQHDGVKISGGGDEFTAAIPQSAVSKIEKLRKDIEHAFGYTISVGIGNSLSEAGTALLVAKLRGKDQIVKFDEEIKKDIKKAKRRVRENRASVDENKLAEAYLNKAEPMNQEADHIDCPYCEATDGVDPSHCTMCHDLEQDTACPFCAESDDADAQAVDGDDCPLCTQESDCPHCAEQEPAIQSPDSQNQKAAPGSPEEKAQYAQMGMNPPQPMPADPSYTGQNEPMSPPSFDQGSPQGDQSQQGIEEGAEGNHSTEALMAIAQQIENETAAGDPLPGDKQMAAAIDDTDLAIGTSTEGAISRPAGYESNVPGDMALDEANSDTGQDEWSDPFPKHPDHGGPDQPTEKPLNAAPVTDAPAPPAPGQAPAGENNDDQNAMLDDEPQLGGVLQQGLDSQADGIQREKVVQMASQALQGFKGCKDIIEKSKQAAPQLYQSSIMMLKAMIEMAKMLGLDGGIEQGSQTASDPNSAMPGEEQVMGDGDEWKEVFPKHPDHGGQAKPEHAPSGGAGQSPKSDSPVGQPIGKLSAKHTTKHVAKTPLPIGAVNGKGQQKTIDDKTGKVRFIDMKEGRVKGPSGVPVKPPKQG